MSERYDLVVVGAGAGGLTAAVRADALGLQVCVVEALDKLGGATAFSGGQVWVGANHLMKAAGMEDDPDQVGAYIHAITDERGGIEEPVARQWIRRAPDAASFLEAAGAMRWEMIPDFPDYYYPSAPGSKPTGRYLTAAPINGSELGEWRQRLLVSPHFPVGVSYSEILEVGGRQSQLEDLISQRRRADVMTFGTGIAAHLVAAMSRRRIPIRLMHRAVELVREGGAVRGVRCESPGGPVTLRGAVLLTTGTYDWDPELVQRYSWLRQEETGSVAPPSLRGDGIRLAEAAGAEIAALPADSAPHVPGIRIPSTSPHDAGFRSCRNISLPHCFVVDRTGRRFCDDSYYRPITRAVLGERDSEGRSSHLPFFLVWDERHHAKYGLGPVPPGGEYPAGMAVAQGPSLTALARKLGIDPAGLEETAARFNVDAAAGRDGAFGRGQNLWIQRFSGDPGNHPSPIIGPVSQPPFFGIRLYLLGTGIGAAGIRAGLDGRALRHDGSAIEGLFAAGTSAAMTTSGTGYNSGFSISRAITFGYLAANAVAASARRGGTSRG